MYNMQGAQLLKLKEYRVLTKLHLLQRNCSNVQKSTEQRLNISKLDGLGGCEYWV
ncbi:hypothetical protein M2109_003931 [Paenibacillus sp. PastH-3]|jgi:hypothetical protein|nr:hypothetical protein [Paenibacillus sp. PastH-4]MDH6445723.1 hypothetical protein [Paenibacillus sp. PastF-4]MDH6529610.1 hypothetical protein [Paenibacillus sp. PastH-3]